MRKTKTILIIPLRLSDVIMNKNIIYRPKGDRHLDGKTSKIFGGCFDLLVLLR